MDWTTAEYHPAGARSSGLGGDPGAVAVAGVVGQVGLVDTVDGIGRSGIIDGNRPIS